MTSEVTITELLAEVKELRTKLEEKNEQNEKFKECFQFLKIADEGYDGDTNYFQCWYTDSDKRDTIDDFEGDPSPEILINYFDVL